MLKEIEETIDRLETLNAGYIIAQRQYKNAEAYSDKLALGQSVGHLSLAEAYSDKLA